MFFHRNRKPRKEDDEPQPIQMPPVVIKGARATALNALIQGRPFMLIADTNGLPEVFADKIDKQVVFLGIRLIAKHDKQALETLTDLVIDLNRKSKNNQTK